MVFCLEFERTLTIYMEVNLRKAICMQFLFICKQIAFRKDWFPIELGDNGNVAAENCGNTTRKSSPFGRQGLEDVMNFSKGSFSGRNIASIRFWLDFVASLWLDATHDSCDDEGNPPKAYTELVGLIQGINGDGDDLPFLLQEFGNLADALASCCASGNETNSSIRMKDDILQLGWDGTWTQGRYLYVYYQPTQDIKIRVEWDTATDCESSFMALPSSAEGFIASGADPDASIEGLEQAEVDRRREVVVQITEAVAKPYGFPLEFTEAGVKDFASRLAGFIETRLSDPDCRRFEDMFPYPTGWPTICETYIAGSLKSCRQNAAINHALWDFRQRCTGLSDEERHRREELWKVFDKTISELVDYQDMVRRRIWGLPVGEPRITVDLPESKSASLPADVVRQFYSGEIRKGHALQVRRETAEFLRPITS
jgi:hypothetical protein